MLLITYLILLLFGINCQNTRTNFQVKRFILCNNTQGLMKFSGNITKEGNNYYATGRFNTPIALDENVGITCKIESKVATAFVELFTIREKYFCKAANMYAGELWYDMQRAAQVIPKTCPMPPGRYEVHHALIDFSKASLQTFPFGKLKFTGKLIDNRRPQNNLLCLEMEVENVP